MVEDLKPIGKNPKFRRAKPVRLFEQAVEQIRSLILEGYLKPGDQLPSENQLSKMLDVSRSSVREALRALEGKGIIIVKSGAGAFVAEDALVFGSVNDAISRLVQRKDQLLQLLQVRWAMECLSISLASNAITERELAELEAIVNRQEAVVKDGSGPDSISELARLDEEFHIGISRIGGNEIVGEIINALMPSFYEDNKTIFIVEKGPKLVEEHRQIIKALSDRDPERAEAYMKEHLGRVIEEVQKLERYSEGPINDECMVAGG